MVPGSQHQIFSFKEFYGQLEERVPRGYEAVYDLTRMCSIR